MKSEFRFIIRHVDRVRDGSRGLEAYCVDSLARRIFFVRKISKEIAPRDV